MRKTQKTPLMRIVKMCDSAADLSRRLGVSEAFVAQMLRKANPKPIPGRLCIPLELISGKAVTKEELRPDIFEYPKEVK